MAFGQRMAVFNRLASNRVLGSEFLALERELVPRGPVADERMSA